MMMSLLVGFCFSSESNIAQPSIEVELSNLRDRLIKDAKDKELDSYDLKSILNDKVSMFTGRTHEDHFYSVIQTLCADDHFIRTILMNDFEINQAVCKVFQKIAVKICGKGENNIEEEINNLKVLIDLHQYFNDPDDNYFLFCQWLRYELYSEKIAMDGILYPESLFVARTIIASDNNTSHSKACNSKIWYIINSITNVENNIQSQIAEWIKTIETDDNSCKECSERLDNGELEISLPSRFYVTLAQSSETQKRINGVRKSFHQMKLKENVYELYAVVCEYKYPIDEKSSCYTLTLKENNWYKLTKENVYMINIETGEVLENDVGAKNDKDNKQAREIETDDINVEMWIYYYRKMNK